MLSLSGFFNSIILLGTLQGFIVCCLLFYSKKNKLPDRLLAKLIFLMSLASLNLYLNEIGITNLNGLTATLKCTDPNGDRDANGSTNIFLYPVFA